MNIFCLDKDPVKAAEMMCDKHVVKMIIESCQILSAVQGSLLCRMGFLKHYFVMLTLDDITFKAISVAVQNPDAVNNSLLCYSVGFPRSHSSAVSPVTMAILCCYDRNRYTQKSTTSNGTGWLFVNQFTF
mgnify:CR=1 FL=1